MRFDAFKAEYEHINQLDRNLSKVSLRRYVLDRREDDYGAFELYVNANVVPYPEGEMISLTVYHSRQGVQTNLGVLSATLLHRVAAIREMIDIWIAGVIEELPQAMPWEALLWQLPKSKP